jgi:prophage tail gpP-like protein
LTVPPEVYAGASVEVRMGRDTVMKGQLDDLNHTVAKDANGLELNGRDGAAVLLDCSAQIFSAQDLTLDQIIAKIVRPLGVTKVRIDAETNGRRDRVSVEPGDTAWETLRRAAEANGLWPWFEPDGTLVVGGPNYSTPPVATLIMKRDGKGNNITQVREHRSITERFSEVTVLGQAHATQERAGRHALHATVKDEGVRGYRPKLLVDHEAVNEQIARARGRKLISDARVKGYELSVTVRGHRTEGGVLWCPGQRVRAQVEPLGIDGVYFVMARRFTGLPQMTVLSLREDGAWVVDAHPSKRRHRRGKNAPSAGAILDVVGGGQ